MLLLNNKSKAITMTTTSKSSPAATTNKYDASSIYDPIVNKFGLYQIFLLALLSVAAILGPVPLLSLSFTAAIPPNSYCPDSTEPCREESAVSCDHGRVIDNSHYHSSMAIQFEMLCGDAWKNDLLKSLFMVGKLIGSAVAGFLSDRFGRRPIFLCCAVPMIPCFIAVPFVTSFPLFAFLQTVNGGLQTGSFLVGYILLMEAVSSKTRTFCGMMNQTFYSFSFVYIGLIAYSIRDYKWQLFIMVIPTVLFIPYYWLFPESIRWAFQSGKTTLGIRLLKRAARMNRVKLDDATLTDAEHGSKPTDTLLVDGTLPNGEQKMVHSVTEEHGQNRAENISILSLFRTFQMARTTIVTFFAWMVCSMVYYGLSLNTGDLPGNEYVNFIVSGLVEIPGYLIAMPMLEYFGRRPALIILYVVSGVCCIASGLIPNNNTVSETLITVMAAIGKLAVTGAYGLVYQYAAELFPTGIRNAACALCSMMARVGSILAPQIHLLVYYAADWWPIVIYGGFALLAAGFSLVLPETKGHKLPETMQDALDICRGVKKVDSSDKKLLPAGSQQPLKVIEMQTINAAAPTPVTNLSSQSA